MPWVGEEGSVREVESGCENGRESERGEARGALKMVRNVYVFLWVVVPLSFSPFHLISIISVYLFMFMFLSSFLLHSLFLLVLSLILVSQHFFSSFLFLTFSDLFLIVHASLFIIHSLLPLFYFLPVLPCPSSIIFFPHSFHTFLHFFPP